MRRLLLALMLVLTACGPRFGAPETGGPPLQEGVQAAAQSAAEQTATPIPDGPLWDGNGGAPDPAELLIPRLEVASPLLRLGLDPDRVLEVPSDPDLAGWYVGSPRPGDLGPAVLVGHVDSYTGPGVFARLEELEPGEQIYVRGDTGELIPFTVERVEHHTKAEFPTERVYSDTDRPELRLITCGGPFDRGARAYRDNIIVYATLTGWTR